MLFSVISFLIVMVLLSILFFYSFNILFQSKCNDRIMKSISKHINSNNLKILDLGCGSCCLNKIIDKNHKNQFQIISLDVVNLGKCSIPTLFDAKNIPFKDKEFDIGLCAFVLHHTKNQEKLLQELKRTCSKVIILEDTPKTQNEWKYAYKHAQSS